MESTGIESIHELDMIDIIRLIQRRKGKFSFLLLSDLSDEFEKHGFNTDMKSGNASEFFKVVRKIVLDGLNDYTRSVNRVLVGNDVEDA